MKRVKLLFNCFSRDYSVKADLSNKANDKFCIPHSPQRQFPFVSPFFL